MKFTGIALLLCFVVFTKPIHAQTLPVGLLYDTDDYFRRQQLLGNDSSKSSFMLRPLYVSDQNDVALSEGLYLQDLNRLIASYPKLKAKFYVLPVVITQQYNSHHPYGMNDGPMIPAKGYQTMVSAGVYAEIGPLSIQFRPEFVYAANQNFRKVYELDNGREFKSGYAIYYNSIDQPEQFGQGGYQKFNWGQSSIRLNAGPVSLGLSSENLWWGPGIRNSLLMSNQAAGFKHLTLNTTRPVKTPVGSFEAQVIAGRLESSGVPLPSDNVFRPKRNDWRYLSGLMFTYQPKWIPNLYLGFDRTYMVYHNFMGNGFIDYFPVFSGIQKKDLKFDTSTGSDEEDPRKFDQRLSFSMRWVMPEANSEIYFQFGKNDHNYNYRDAFVEPEHSRAYVAGFRKLFALHEDDTYIQAGIEITQLEAALTRITRGAGYWYSHSSIRQGYTNEGQVLGAGIGSGSNLQSLDVSWVKGLKKIGVQLERTVNNNDLFYRAFRTNPDVRRHWVDLGITGKLNWDYKRFIVNSQIAYIRSLNYQWALEDPTDSFWDWNKQDVNNFHLKIGLLYRF
jgi:hypothetical protein